MGRTEDDQLIREMLAPDVEQALESLGYWLRRRTRLPFYRRAARREADQAIAFWQACVIHDVPRAPLAALASGRALVHTGRAVASYHARRIAQRATAIVVGTIAATYVLVLLASR